MDFWQHFYSNFDIVAFEIFGFKVYWYGIMYAFSLLVALFLAKYFVRIFDFKIDSKILDNYFLWAELGVILGARVGFVLFYDDERFFYLFQPWQLFNPFGANGEFIGIRGMSFHGGVIGFFISSFLFCKKYKQNLWEILDLAALCIGGAYFFGRIGNFLNQELFGRASDVAWGIYVNGVLRHPSQLYEAFFEGLIVFLIVLFVRKRQKFHGQLILTYAASYSCARFICEFWREPDSNLGFLAFGLTMGQILSLFLFLLTIFVFIKMKNSVKFKKAR